MSKSTYRIEYKGELGRLDRVLVAELAESLACSRSQVERWIEQGRVTVDGQQVLKPAFKVESAAIIELSSVEEPTTTLQPLELSLEILFEDKHLLVINKPHGLSMHPGAGNATHTLANAVVGHVGKVQLQVGEANRPGIVHRLDKDTTGIVVVAKSTVVHAALSKQFAERSIDRRYWALVFSTPRSVRAIQQQDQGEVQAPIGRHPTNRKIMAITEQGRPSLTRWRVLERFSHGTLLECVLQSGRTHQIRVHMTSIGSPLIGDKSYGDLSNLPKGLKDASNEFGRQALHAATLSFIHPISSEQLTFSAPLPQDFKALVELFRTSH